MRAGPNWRRPESGATQTPQGKTEGESVTTTSTPRATTSDDATEESTPSGQENLDALEAAVREGEAEESDAKNAANDDSKLPPETAEDLRPFPLNQWFRSQPVLSEELREAIYKRVQKEGATVSLASVEFGVSNERVGAVVRLKQMEKEWVAQVRYIHKFPYTQSCDMMRHLKNSISLEDIHMVRQLKSCSC